jgi:hypothetical protein
LKAGMTDTIMPKITYAQDLSFNMLEDFESKNVFNLNLDTFSRQNFNVTNQNVKYGKICGLMKIDEKSPFMSITTSDALKTLAFNEKVFVEMDYKGGAELRIVLMGNKTTGPVELEFVQLRPQADWNKVYANFRFRDYNIQDYPSFNIIITGLLPKDANGAFTAKSVEEWIDNVKVVSAK